MNIDNLDSYIVKFPTKYEYMLLRKCGMSIKFPFIFCFPESMETNLEQSSLWNKSILFLSMNNFCHENKTLTKEYFEQIYTMPKLDIEYVDYYNIYSFTCKFNSNNKTEKIWNLNIDNKFKLKIYDKIIRHYCELLFLCGEFIQIDDVKRYILTFLI
jgi:hypothetical protein